MFRRGHCFGEGSCKEKGGLDHEYERQSHYFVIVLRNKPQEIIISGKVIKGFYDLCTNIEPFTNAGKQLIH